MDHTTQKPSMLDDDAIISKGLQLQEHSFNDESAMDEQWMDALQKSILRKMDDTSLANEPIVYEFTNDRALLYQYFQLRDFMYRKVHKLQDFEGEEDVYDKISHVLIARKGNLCIGGCRLTIREADEKFLMPLESEQFRLDKILPECELDVFRHAELSRFAVMDSYSDSDVFFNLCKIMHKKIQNEGVRYLFAKSPYTLARNWRMVAHSFGANATIHKDIDIPENPLYPEIKWYITSCDMLTSAQAKRSKTDTETSQQHEAAHTIH